MLIFKNFRTKNTFSYKYLTLLNNKKIEILSNLKIDTFEKLLEELSKSWEEIQSYKILDCIEFEYTDENDGVTLDTLQNYL